ncbi:MAG: hypothetical protein QXG65_01395 [Thermoplasmata archaeon]
MGTATSDSAPLEWDHLPEEYDPHAFVPRRPFGLIAICGAIAFASIVVIVAAAFYLIGTYLGGWLPAGSLPASLTILNGLSPLSAGILLVFGGAMIGVATALWRQETWAFYTVVTVLVGGIAYLLVTATLGILLVVLAGLFLYLIAVRHYFY